MSEVDLRQRNFTTSSTCSFCGTGCTLLVSVDNGAIVDVQGDKNSPVNRGESCIKGLQAWKYVQSERRLRQPYVRKNGKLHPASWEEALSVIVEGLKNVKTQYGPDAIGCLSSSRATNEVNYLAQKFMRQVIGTNNIDSCNRT